MAVTGCAKATTSATPAPATSAPAASAPAATASASSTSQPPKTARCHTADLSASLEESGAAAGTHYRWIVLKNSSGPTCTLEGYPGVSLVDASGHQLGQPAQRNPVRAPALMTLQHNESAYALVGFPNHDNFPPGKCSTAQSASMRIYPPNELQSLLVTAHEYYCPGFSVSALGAKTP